MGQHVLVDIATTEYLIVVESIITVMFKRREREMREREREREIVCSSHDST